MFWKRPVVVVHNITQRKLQVALLDNPISLRRFHDVIHILYNHPCPALPTHTTSSLLPALPSLCRKHLHVVDLYRSPDPIRSDKLCFQIELLQLIHPHWLFDPTSNKSLNSPLPFSIRFLILNPDCHPNACIHKFINPSHQSHIHSHLSHFVRFICTPVTPPAPTLAQPSRR